MKVGLDITPIIYSRGVSRYTSNLAISLLDYTGLSLSLYGSSLRGFAPLKSAANKISKIALGRTSVQLQHYPPSALDLLWRLGVNRLSNQLPGIKVFHSWDWLQPPDTSFALVSTIHDLAILKFPETAHPKILAMHRRSWEILKKRQAHVIAVSRTTKADIVSLLGYPSYLVHVVHEALPTEVRMVAEKLTEEKYDRIKNKLKLDKPFVLFVGTREPRKNLLRLIKAWEPLANDFDLLIAGEAGWDKTSEPDTVTTQEKGLRLLGRVSDEELAILYSEAAVFAYPSLYEGFGLPILEAFSYGTPVVTSNNSGMQEVAGNAAELVDPESEESIRAGLEKVLGETAGEQQKRLQRMIIRQQMFSWQTVAGQTATVYKQAAEDFAS